MVYVRLGFFCTDKSQPPKFEALGMSQGKGLNCFEIVNWPVTHKVIGTLHGNCKMVSNATSYLITYCTRNYHLWLLTWVMHRQNQEIKQSLQTFYSLGLDM